MNASLGLLLLLSLFVPPLSTDQPQFRTIRLSELTRGTMRTIEVTPKQTTVVFNERTTTGITDPAVWDKLVELAQKLPLDNLESVPIPSKKHQFDGALHASLTFVTRDSTVITPTFDHNAPPRVYKPLVDLLYQQVPPSLRENFTH